MNGVRAFTKGKQPKKPKQTRQTLTQEHHVPHNKIWKDIIQQKSGLGMSMYVCCVQIWVWVHMGGYVGGVEAWEGGKLVSG